MLVLTFVAGLPSPPFAASRAALLPETVPRQPVSRRARDLADRLAEPRSCSATSSAASSSPTIGARGALVVNSAFVPRVGAHTEPAPRRPCAGRERQANRHLRAGAHALWSDVDDPSGRGLGSRSRSATAIIPESQVAVYALRHLGTGDSGAGCARCVRCPSGRSLASSVIPFHGSARTLLRIAGLVDARRRRSRTRLLRGRCLDAVDPHRVPRCGRDIRARSSRQTRSPAPGCRTSRGRRRSGSRRESSLRAGSGAQQREASSRPSGTCARPASSRWGSQSARVRSTRSRCPSIAVMPARLMAARRPPAPPPQPATHRRLTRAHASRTAAASRSRQAELAGVSPRRRRLALVAARPGPRRGPRARGRQ